MQLSNNVLKIIVACSVVLVAVSVAFNFLYSVPAKNRLAEDQYRQERIDKCLKEAEETYRPGFEILVPAVASGDSTQEVRDGLITLSEQSKNAKDNCQQIK